jgi:hypothetical protein
MGVGHLRGVIEGGVAYFLKRLPQGKKLAHAFGGVDAAIRVQGPQEAQGTFVSLFDHFPMRCA